MLLNSSGSGKSRLVEELSRCSDEKCGKNDHHFVIEFCLRPRPTDDAVPRGFPEGDDEIHALLTAPLAEDWRVSPTFSMQLRLVMLLRASFEHFAKFLTDQTCKECAALHRAWTVAHAKRTSLFEGLATQDPIRCTLPTSAKIFWNFST